jgi:hypothetical protein
MAVLFDATGSYTLAFTLAFGVAAAAALVFVGATRPQQD